MGKVDLELKARMDGCLYAIRQIENYNASGKNGLEEFKNEMKRRGFLRLDISITEKIWNDQVNMMFRTLYANTITTLLYALKCQEGWGKVRLQRTKNTFDKVTKDAFDLDYMCEHYVRLQDYAISLNQDYDLGLDINLVSANEDQFDESMERYNTYEWLKGIINQLDLWVYCEAADKFREKIRAKENS